jgi:3-phenylpropionate/trans-cinnamate dioxygenase ferredoxin reductase subunit
MPKICKVEVNDQIFSAARGDLLLDAALMNGVDIPHDCRSGYCGSCRVRVLAGRCVGGVGGDPGIVHACQSRIVSDLKIEVEDVPDVVTVSGRVAELTLRAPDVMEVGIELQRPLKYLPGQYCSLRFRGFPARCFSPTAPLDWPCNPKLLRFHIRKLKSGRVSSQLGRRIRVGHHVKLAGPFGSAFLRDYPSERLVLVAGGTGFAPIWSVAEAAITEQPRRELVLVAGARKLESLYMLPALCRLALFPNVTIIPVVSEQQTMSNAVRKGSPLDYVPPLSRNDVVYCAGAPAMVEAISHVAAEAGAKCYSDPFEPAVRKDDKAGLLSRAADWLGSSELKSGEMLTSPPLSMADWTPLDANREFQSGRERRERHSASADLYPNQPAPA